MSTATVQGNPSHCGATGCRGFMGDTVVTLVCSTPSCGEEFVECGSCTGSGVCSACWALLKASEAPANAAAGQATSSGLGGTEVAVAVVGGGGLASPSPASSVVRAAPRSGSRKQSQASMKVAGGFPQDRYVQSQVRAA